MHLLTPNVDWRPTGGGINDPCLPLNPWHGPVIIRDVHLCNIKTERPPWMWDWGVRRYGRHTYWCCTHVFGRTVKACSSPVEGVSDPTRYLCFRCGFFALSRPRLRPYLTNLQFNSHHMKSNVWHFSMPIVKRAWPFPLYRKSDMNH